MPFDRFEAITRDATSMIGDETGFNDSLLFSSLISPINPATGRLDELANLTFNIGDAGDWYLIPTPPAQNRFGSADRAVLSHSDITVTFNNKDDQALFTMTEPNPKEPLTNPPKTISVWRSGSGTVNATVNDPFQVYDNFSLFAAVQTDPQGQLAFLPVERFNGVPQNYLLHVNNVKSYGIRGLEVPKAPVPILPATDTTISFTLTIDGTTSSPLSVSADGNGNHGLDPHQGERRLSVR